MDTLTIEEELLLMEMERRDGIYSFIFHELENNDNKLNEKTNVESHLDIHAIKQINTEMVTTEKPATYEQPNIVGFSLKSKRSYLTSDFTTYNQPKTTTSVFQDSFSLNKISNSQLNIRSKSSLNFMHQKTRPVSSLNFMQQFCSFPSINVRRAKSPFSYLHEPMVRNRRHKLKETKEYKNFMRNLTKVADLRDLFPLDRDVHAPFLNNN